MSRRTLVATMACALVFAASCMGSSSTISPVRFMPIDAPMTR